MRIPLRDFLALLRTYLRAQRRQMLLLALLLAIHIAVQLAAPQLVGRFIDDATAGAPLAQLVRLALLFFGLTLLSQVLSVASTYVGENVAWATTNQLRLDLLRHVLGLGHAFHKQHTPGELLERIDGDVATLATFFSRLVVYVAGNTLLLAGVLILLLLEEWRIGLPLSIITFASLVSLLWLRGLAVPMWRVWRETAAQLFGYLGEALEAREELTANNAGGYLIRRFDGLVQQLFAIRRRTTMAMSLLWPSDIAAYAARTTAIFLLAAWLWQRGEITLGSVYLIVFYSDLLSRPMTEIRNQLESLQAAEAGIGRIRALLETKPLLADPGPAGTPLPPGPLDVRVENLSFAYEDDATTSVLTDVSFHLPPGRVLGLLGRTGSGKTTLARLLLRTYDPTAGTIRFNGISPADVARAPLRRRIAMVSQDVQLLQGTVRDNLTFYDPAVDDQQLLTVIRRLRLDDWLATLPAGLDTPLAGNYGLSAGQAQLLAMARVFLRRPDLVILDEASSRLDPATEQQLEQAVDTLLQERTAVIIAHRLSTIQRADDILILDQGRVVEHGPRRALAADPDSHFSRLLRTGLEAALA